MLSLTSGTKIAVFEQDKEDKKAKKPEKFIYIKENDRKAIPEIDTNKEKKLEVFEEYCRRDKKLRSADIQTLIAAFKDGSAVSPKLERKYEDAVIFVEKSLKHYLDYDKGVILHPIITQPTFRMFVSGLSGSGKSTYVAQILKYNKFKHIFLMSPVLDDKALKDIKPVPVRLDLSTYEKDFEAGPFQIEHLPPHSVVIMDDTDTADDSRLYHRAKVALLERGRHLEVSTIIVSHNALGGNTKPAVTQLLECEFYVIFPRSNRAHAEKLLKGYVGLNQEMSNLVLDSDSRSVMIKKSYPSYFIGEKTVGTLN